MKLPHDNFITDEQLAKLYREKEAEKPFTAALSLAGLTHLSGEEQKEVEALWDIYDVIEDEGKKYAANMELAQEVVDEAAEYLIERKEEHSEKGEKSHGGDVASPFQSLMQLNWLIGAPIAVLVLAVVVVTSIGSSNGGDPLALQKETSPETAMTEKGADADTFSLSAAPDPMERMFAVLEDEANKDNQILSDAHEDVSLAGGDGDELTAISESYDPNAF